MRCRLALILLIGFSVAACRSNAARDAPFESYHSVLALEADGSVNVTETITLGAARSPQAFDYALPADRIDRITNVELTIDGSVVSATAGSTVAEMASEPGGRVRWSPEAGRPGAATVSLHYRAVGALALQGARGELRWSVAPRDGAAADEVSFDFSFPDEAVAVVGPVIEGTDWEGERRPRGLTARKGTVAGDEVAVLTVDLVLADATFPEPRWQFDAARGGQLMPAFLAAGLFLLVVGVGIWWMAAFSIAGSADPVRDRATAARGFRLAGLVLLGLAAVAGAATPATLGRYGVWPFALPAGILGVALVFLLAAARFGRRQPGRAFDAAAD